MLFATHVIADTTATADDMTLTSLTSLTTTTTTKYCNCILKSICLTLFQSYFKTFFTGTFNASKVIFIHFYLNGGLHVVFYRKTEYEQNFGFLHIPNC